VVDRGLAGVHIERAGLKQNIARVFSSHSQTSRQNVGRGGGPTAVEDSEGIEAIASATQPDRRVATPQAPAHVVAAAQFGFLGNEQAQKFAAYVAEANDREIIGRNAWLFPNQCAVAA